MEASPEHTPILPQIKLLPGERLSEISFYEVRALLEGPSSLQQMMRLTRAASPEQIGINGPSVAALAFDISARTSVEPGESPLREPDDTTIPSSTPEHLRLYEVIFGRDALRVAIELIARYPALARSTTLRLAELQGVGYEERFE